MALLEPPPPVASPMRAMACHVGVLALSKRGGGRARTMLESKGGLGALSGRSLRQPRLAKTW
eukprot:860751-Pelagomonas_calceolata.AAC.1